LSASRQPDLDDGALSGLRVLEIGSLIAGPFAGRLLGDNGAEVVKVESPERPDPLRGWGQVHEGGRGLFWTIHARNKRCVTLDLKCRAGQELFEHLARVADVVIESFRPGTLERWDLGFERLSQINPRLILARVSGYGQTGPKSRQPGYASMAEAMAGMRHITGIPGAPPVRMSLSLGDSLAGLFAAQGILLALVARERTGVGQVVDTALTDSCLAVTESMIPDFDRVGHIRQPSGTRLDAIAPSNIYKSSDGRWLVVAANQDTVFARLCDAMGKPELAADPRYATHVARARHQDLLDAEVGRWVKSRSSADVMKALAENDVVCGPVNTVAEVVSEQQFRARQMLVPHFDRAIGDSVLGPGITPKLSSNPGTIRWAGPPEPGEDNDAVYSEWVGLDGDRIQELRRQRVI
jgi:formyl-CoA transferase